MFGNSGRFPGVEMLRPRIWFFGATFVVWLSWYCLLIGVDGQVTHPAEVAALRAIKKSLIDTNRNLTNWNRGDPCTSNWTGVLCFNTTMDDGYLHLRELNLMKMNLSGSLSPELGSFSHMKILDVMWNRITGSIPKEIGNIKSLELLLLNGNNLTGSLPEELGYLPNLDRIQIDENQISGPIPKSFANLNKTKHFHMNNNSLSGQIPPELSVLPSLVYMLLDNNNLSGYLPPELAELPSLLILQLDNNHFDGMIPPSYGNMSHLLKLSLRNCGLQGPIPDLSRISGLSYIDLSSNQLSGLIPPDKLHEYITTIDLSNNNLSGTIPTNLSGLPRLQRLSLANNALNGSVPSVLWQNWTSNETLFLDLQNNELSNILGSINLPPNVTVRLGGNPLCSSANLVQFCGAISADISSIESSINSSNSCPVLSCPYPFEYAPASPAECYCAAPLFIGYRLKSSGFFDFLPYMYRFEGYLTSGLELELYQLKLSSFIWQDGRRLKMYLKIFPKYIDNNSSYFNRSEVLRIQSMFTGWLIPHSDIFGPYELLNFSLWGPYADYLPSPSGSGIGKGAVAGIVVGTVAGSVILSAISILIFRRHIRKHHAAIKSRRNPKGLDLQTGTFTLRQIKAATDNFDAANKIGEGGFGSVYKGLLADGTMIAVKKLSSKSKQGNREFVNEIGIISALEHFHLVKLYGCCIAGSELLLVYEYMENNSLARALYGPEELQLKLDWRTRYKICIGIARGLAFLHEESRLKIVHRDIKATNVLLDKNLNPKISDFGLAKLDEENNSHISTRIAGTYGYMAPEYVMHGYLTDKADVYSFGIVALEIVGGKSNSSFRPKETCFNLLGWALDLKEEGKLMELVDPKLGSDFKRGEAMVMINVALLCTDVSPSVRPTMSSVIRMLEGKVAVKEQVSNGSNSIYDQMKLKGKMDDRQDSQEATMTGSMSKGMSTDRTWTDSSQPAGHLSPINLDQDMD